MLTAKKRAFIEQYKVDRNASRAARAAGYSQRWAHTNTSKILSDSAVAAAISQWEQDENEKVAQLQQKRLIQPTKNDYIELTFTKANNVEHEPTAAKYWEIGGKALGYLSNDAKDDAPTFQILVQELNLHLTNNSLINNQVVNNPTAISTEPSKIVASTVSSTTASYGPDA